MNATEKGRYSELLAEAALSNAGFTLLVPSSNSQVERLGTRRNSNEIKRVQVKTIYPRERDGRSYYVIFAKRGNGNVYTAEEADYLVGVINGRVFMTENRGCGEYWVRAEQAAEKWQELPIN